MRENNRTPAAEAILGADAIKHLLGQTPFLDPRYYFPIDLRQLAENAPVAIPSEGEPILHYEQRHTLGGKYQDSEP